MMRPEPTSPAFITLVKEVTGEEPKYFGTAFNTHYMTSEAFIKVTHPWVLPKRVNVELATASALHTLGLPVAKPLENKPRSFINQAGLTQWVSFWERLTPLRELSQEEGTDYAAEWIEKLWLLPAPADSYTFQLHDFDQAVGVRLQGNKTMLAKAVIAETNEAVQEALKLEKNNYGFIHGDLHNNNLLFTVNGLMVIDWESSCLGPKEWDAAQNIRYTNPQLRPMQKDFWLARNCDEELLDCYFKVRTLSSLSHMVASGQETPIYFQCLEDLGWNHFLPKS